MSVLPSKDRAYLEEHKIEFREIVCPPAGVIFPAYRLPNGLFDRGTADILIQIPDRYPDVQPDMFYALPWLKLVKAQRYPSRADQPFAFGGQNWQRWSRHSDEWRPGIDGIWTMLRRIDTALKSAA